MSDAAEVITVTMGDKTFQAGRRTAAHLEWTVNRLANRNPGAHLHVIQPCYNRGVGASEGTHDYDCCLDVSILGVSWAESQAFLRAAGWGAWWRTPQQGFSNHIHMISLGFSFYDIKVGKYVDGGLSLYGEKVTSAQVEDYFLEAYGLEDMHTPGSDDSWFPPDKLETIFNYEEWLDMGYASWSGEDKREFWKDFKTNIGAAIQSLPATSASAVWSFLVRADPKLTARAAVRETHEEVKKT